MTKAIISPAGIAEYPRLNQPDTKFSEDGVYRVNLILDPEVPEHQQFLDDLEDWFADAVLEISEDKRKKVKEANKPFEVIEEGDNKGKWRVKFKMKAIVRPRNSEPFTQQPKLFDAQKHLCPDAQVGAGSQIKVAFDTAPFYTPSFGAGLSLRLRAVQILKLEEYCSDFGFEAEEGYTVNAESSEDIDF